MKTIKQIADEIGVSKQAVHQKRKSKALSTALHPFTSTVDGVVYISVDGENLLKSAFLKNDRQEEPTTNRKQIDNEPTTDRQTNDDILVVLKATIDTLQKQLEIKDNQIQALSETIKAQAQSINADNKTALAEKIIQGQQLLSNNEPQKKSFISRLFGK